MWHISDMEFVMRWSALGDSELPVPLTFRSRIPLFDDYRRAQQRIMDQIRSAPNPRLDYALAEAAKAPLRMVVHARNGLDPESPNGCIRILAASTLEQGFVIRQHIGESIWHSTGFTVTEHGSDNLPSIVVGALPRLAGGRLPEMTLAFGYSEDNQMVSPWPPAFKHMPAILTGMIEVSYQIPGMGPRGLTRKRLVWRDVLHDGRYAMLNAGRPKVLPADALGLSTLVRDLAYATGGLPAPVPAYLSTPYGLGPDDRRGRVTDSRRW